MAAPATAEGGNGPDELRGSRPKPRHELANSGAEACIVPRTRVDSPWPKEEAPQPTDHQRETREKAAEAIGDHGVCPVQAGSFRPPPASFRRRRTEVESRTRKT